MSFRFQPSRGRLILLIAAFSSLWFQAAAAETKAGALRLMLALDISGSMWMEDFGCIGKRINRLHATRPCLLEFIERLNAASFGLVVFAGEAQTRVPLAGDRQQLLREIRGIEIGTLPDGTALLDALKLTLAQFQPAKMDQDRTGAVILITDGHINPDRPLPAAVVNLVRARGVPIHTIVASRDGTFPMPVFNDRGKKLGYRRAISSVDEGLSDIADVSGGRYFRATDVAELDDAFRALAELLESGLATKSTPRP